jgi:quercetin dioxygenase-like cupin family protein
MTLSRRQLPALLSAFAAPAQSQTLTTKAFRYEDLPVKENGKNRSRAVLQGRITRGAIIEMHETELAPGLVPHGSHHHVHDEIVVVREGQVEFTVGGKVDVLGPGSVVYVASNVEHGLRNAGDTRARYFIITLGRDEA